MGRPTAGEPPRPLPLPRLPLLLDDALGRVRARRVHRGPPARGGPRMTIPAHGAPEDSNARVFRWLRAGTAWRPFTAALLLIGLLFAAAVDYATSQREDLCHANN